VHWRRWPATNDSKRPAPADLTTKPFSQYDEAILKQAKL
jgi:hypothetical protein